LKRSAASILRATRRSRNIACLPAMKPASCRAFQPSLEDQAMTLHRTSAPLRGARSKPSFGVFPKLCCSTRCPTEHARSALERIGVRCVACRT